MAGIAGKSARLKVSTTDGSYATVAGLRSISLDMGAGTADDSEYGVNWNQNVQTLNNFKISASGSYRPDDTSGQVVIRTAFLGSSDLYAEVLPNGTNGFKGYVRVTKFAVEPPIDGVAQVSIELEGSGAVTVV